MPGLKICKLTAIDYAVYAIDYYVYALIQCKFIEHSDTPKASRNGRSAQRKLILDDMHVDLSDSSSTSDVDSE